MPIFERWYERKKPTLHIRILKSIALEGELSKRKLQEKLTANYPDISDAVELLKKRKIIERGRVDFKRRPENYYKLTKRGLEAIIDEYSDAEIFWKAMISYYSLNKDPISPDELDKYYKAFEAKYVGYVQALDFFSQYDFIDELFNNVLEIRKGGAISIFQKVMECIALHRSITLEQIIEYLETQRTKNEKAALDGLRKIKRDPNAQFPEFMTGVERKRYQENDVTEENIINILNRYTLSSSYSLEEFSEISDHVEIHKRYSDLISHLLIHADEDETGIRYELTLFGVALTLAIVYYDHHNPLKIFFNEFLHQQGRNNYYNIVVSNYKDKVPLIFAKWQPLTKSFYGVDYLMANFEPVFYKEIRDHLVSLPMNMGGVKELYENMRGMAYHRYSKLTEIYETGMSALEMRKKANPDCMLPINKMLSNIEQLLATADLKKFMINIAEQNSTNICKTNILTSIENSFANELSFSFYIALTRKAAFPPTFRDEQVIPSRLVEFMMQGTEQSNFVKPRQILHMILEDDKEMKEVKDAFLLWMKNSISYEKQVIENMFNLQSEVGIDSNL